MSERLEPRVYLGELRDLEAAISDATCRALALDEEEKPLAVAGDLDLGQLVWLLERTAERAVQAVAACEILLATDGLPLE